MLDMEERYKALDAVAARDNALFAFLMQENPDATGPEGMTAMMQSTIKFNAAWKHAVPSQRAMVLADRAGRLSEFTTDANRAFALDIATTRSEHSAA